MLDAYAGESLALAEELATSLSESEIEWIRDTLAGCDLQQWLAWCEQHDAEVRAYVRATPSQRENRKKWVKQRPLLVLCAYHHCMKAATLLKAASQLEPGPSYRKMAEQAGVLYDEMEDDSPENWPWGDPDPLLDLYQRYS